MEKVKIFCHTCPDASGMIKERNYPVGNEIFVVCPECDGKGYTEVEKAREEKKMKAFADMTRADFEALGCDTCHYECSPPSFEINLNYMKRDNLPKCPVWTEELKLRSLGGVD